MTRESPAFTIEAFPVASTHRSGYFATTRTSVPLASTPPSGAKVRPQRRIRGQLGPRRRLLLPENL